ncbi:hypothetical protein [Clostridium sp. KNHs205]|jgi:hypothetical protein|uniref:hypothetical protein n=1 Tax=Clostridium sp. KNHs205 TaxID=1449050 RepID=UPI0012DBE42A|nr:hypothetical protein [Clostridium sp. KNHs205]
MVWKRWYFEYTYSLGMQGQFFTGGKFLTKGQFFAKGRFLTKEQFFAKGRFLTKGQFLTKRQFLTRGRQNVQVRKTHALIPRHKKS